MLLEQLVLVNHFIHLCYVGNKIQTRANFLGHEILNHAEYDPEEGGRVQNINSLDTNWEVINIESRDPTYSPQSREYTSRVFCVEIVFKRCKKNR